MKKEVLIAIIIGFTLGLIITIGVYTAQKSINQRDQLISPASNGDSSSAETQASHTITVTSPKNYAISNQNELKITGITSPNSMIAVLAHDSNSLSTANDQGIFTSSVELNAGENIIRLISYDSQGNNAETNLILIYSTADLNTDESDNEEADEE